MMRQDAAEADKADYADADQTLPTHDLLMRRAGADLAVGPPRGMMHARSPASVIRPAMQKVPPGRGRANGRGNSDRDKSDAGGRNAEFVSHIRRNVHVIAIQI